jgi:RING-type zinc-finger
MMRLLFLMVSVVSCVVIATASEGGLLVAEYDDDRKLCPVTNNGTLLFCDPDHLVSDADSTRIVELIHELQNSSVECPLLESDRVEMGVYLRRFRRPASKEAVDGLRSNLGMGYCSILLYMVVTPTEQVFVYLSWGHGMDRVLSGLVAQSMKDGMLPFLRHDLYGEAIQAAILDLTAFLNGDHTGELGEYLMSQHLKHLGIASWVLLFFCSCFGYFPLCLLDLFLGYRAWRRIRIEEEERRREIVQEVQDKLQDMEEQNSTNSRIHQSTSNGDHPFQEGEYMSRCCPICLEEFPTASSDKLEQGPPSEDTPLFQKGQLGSDGKPIMSLPCGHVFDRSCVVEWMIALRTKNRNARLTCPVCMEGF